LARRNRRPLGPLDLRSQAILRAVIEEYVTTAQPVGSQALVERYGLGVYPGGTSLVPPLDESRRVNEQDCTRPIEDGAANLRCR